MSKHIAVFVDDECYADEWWQELRERYPNFARSLSHNECVVIAESLWEELATIPGFNARPDHAKKPIIASQDYVNRRQPLHLFEKLC